MVGPSFSQGTIDIWDTSAPDGTMKLIKQLVSDDTLGPNAVLQASPHPNQAVLDNTGRFFVVNDLGTDTLLLVDSANDTFNIVNRVRVAPDGCGPGHGAFFPPTAEVATHYLVLCEIQSLAMVYQLNYLTDSIQFVPLQTISTFDPNSPPFNLSSSAASDIVISNDNSDVYISNRNTGNATDLITHFKVVNPTPGGPISLEFADQLSSGGISPLMFSFNTAQDTLFSTNQNGSLGLLALQRTPAPAPGAAATDATAVQPGVLNPSPTAAVSNVFFGEPINGPQFVLQIA